CAGNRCDGSAIEAVRLEKCACRVEKAGPHFLASGARCPHTVTGGGGTGRAARTLLGAYAAAISITFGLRHGRSLNLLVCIAYKQNGRKRVPIAYLSNFGPKPRSLLIWAAMSALGQKQTCVVQTSMSALPPKADIGARSLLNLRYPSIRIVWIVK